MEAKASGKELLQQAVAKLQLEGNTRSEIAQALMDWLWTQPERKEEKSGW